MQSNLKILFVDDHAGMRESLTTVLSQRNKSYEFFTAKDEKTAIQIINNKEINIAIIDLNLGGTSDKGGISLIPELRKINPSLNVIIYTMFNDPLHIQLALKANIQGYVTKDADINELEKSIKVVTEGNIYYNKKTIAIMHTMISSDSVRNPDKEVNNTAELFKKYSTLTPKEQEIFLLVVHNKSAPDIAKSLNKTEKTVNNQKSSLYQKLNIHDRVEAIEAAKNLGLLLD